VVNLYLDSSSLIKLLIEEEGSAIVDQLVKGSSVLSTSVVTWPELRGALARAIRGGRLTKDGHAEALASLQDLWRRMQILAFDEAIATSAGDHAANHYLRGLDAIHLASALAYRDASGEPLAFSAFDHRLADAAAASGLDIP
jgi:predicted nucleic acid-binding protein